MIHWTAFTWEAFATLFTGLVAVGGAIFVGIRQVGISDRQSRILEQQAKIDGLRLQSELFDRRYEVYEATSAFLAATLQGSGRPDAEIERRFLAAKTSAQFLFAGSVVEQLQAIYQDCNNLIFTRAALDRMANARAKYDATLPDRDMKQSAIVSDRLQNLASTFGSELKLSAVDSLEV